jgi:hypothetical protein
MLTDALDGTLSARDAEAFDAHSTRCTAGCPELLEEAKRGTEWLRFLRETPEAPQGLLEKILVGTSGIPDAPPLTASGAVALPSQPWLGVSFGMLQRHMAESRILMTVAMAFFSLALTLNLTGVRLNQLRLSDLSPSALASSLSHQYYTTSAHLTRYYLNLRIVYELESRVNEIRRDNSAPAQRPAAQQQQQQQPAQKPQPQPSSKPGGGAAHKAGSIESPEQEQRGYVAPVPVLAMFRSDANQQHSKNEAGPRAQIQRCARSSTFSLGPVSPQYLSERPGNQYKAFFLLRRTAEPSLDGLQLEEKSLKPSERSLV